MSDISDIQVDTEIVSKVVDEPDSISKNDVMVEITKIAFCQIVENFLKQNKAINNRYDKDISNFESLIYLGCLKLGLQIIIRNFYKF